MTHKCSWPEHLGTGVGAGMDVGMSGQGHLGKGIRQNPLPFHAVSH